MTPLALSLDSSDHKLVRQQNEMLQAVSLLEERVEQLNKKIEKLEQGNKFVIIGQFAFAFERAINDKIGNTKKCTPFSTLIDQKKLPSDFMTELTNHYSTADIYEFRDALKELKEPRKPYTNNHDLTEKSIEESDLMILLEEFYLTLTNYSKEDLEPYVNFMINYITKARGRFELLNTQSGEKFHNVH